ncbi:MAG TPA: transporter substrate-binding domain-containing protein [Burkholderiales bacterium]
MTPWRVLIAMLAAAGLALAGCASTPAPDQETRQVLAPTGKLRVGVYLGSPTSMVRDAGTREPRGVTYELGRELAQRLGVPFEAVEFPRVSDVVDAMKDGRVDFTVTNATAARAMLVDFTAPLLDLELGYLVLPGSPVTAIGDVDRAGIRVGVTQGSTSQSSLSRQLKNATLVPSATVVSAIEMLSRREVDAYATNKAILFEMSDRLPGSRVLDGRWGVEHLAIGFPKGRESGAAYLRQFADEAKRGGSARRAAERAGLRGTAEAMTP